MTTKFIHTADWQLGKNFHRIPNADKRARLRQERIAAIGRIGAVAKSEQATFILVAGDLFDSATPTRETVAAALEAIGALDLPVIAIPGNHDHGGPGGVWEQPFFASLQPDLAPNLTVLLEPKPFELPDAWILPCPLWRRIMHSDPSAWIREAGALDACQDGRPVILLAHGSTQTFSATGLYDDEEGEGGAAHFIDLERIPPGSVDYCALGDWHGTKEIQPWAWFSGTPEQDRFNKGNDHDPGNVLAVKAGRGTPPEVTVHRTSAFGWHTMEFTFSGDESLAQLKAAVEDRLAGAPGGSLLQLDLGGSLGLSASERLQSYLEAMDARLLRLKLRDASTVVPTAEEIEALTTRTGDPLIARVASMLKEDADAGGESSETARAALEILFPLVQKP